MSRWKREDAPERVQFYITLKPDDPLYEWAVGLPYGRFRRDIHQLLVWAEQQGLLSPEGIVLPENGMPVRPKRKYVRRQGVQVPEVTPASPREETGTGAGAPPLKQNAPVVEREAGGGLQLESGQPFPVYRRDPGGSGV